MQGLLSWVFFLVATVVMSAGVAMAASGKGMWLLVVSFLAYLLLFIKLGCLPSSSSH